MPHLIKRQLEARRVDLNINNLYECLYMDLLNELHTRNKHFGLFSFSLQVKHFLQVKHLIKIYKSLIKLLDLDDT